ncbi:hypothetical protein [Longitalea luteola]|uniref:hypothetical protein n=1 Tax=Longitalea luteola TaxID=2812563 RepID=UPI001A978860|nr:hypothetical protein [Longitalea luteola]
MSNWKTAFAKSKYLELSEHGSRLNLSFTSHLITGNAIIGLDGIKNCLFVLDTSHGVTRSYVIDLNKVHAVSVIKTYRNIEHDELKNRSITEFLERIALQFHFSDTNDTIVLPFYDCNADQEKDRQQLELNAENWQKMLSKMSGSRSDKHVGR